jgi:hypothetical protein
MVRMLRVGRRLLLAVSLLLACKAVPTSILLEIRAGTGVADLEELRLTVISSADVPVKERRVPAEGRPTLPGELVLYPPDAAATVRILVRGLRGGSVTAEGATVVPLERERQTRATVTLGAGRLPDRDGDGIPDGIDSCPDLPNPSQGPCSGDAGVDARPDAAGDGAPLRDLAPDRGGDLGGDLDCDRDKDTYRALACGGDDCDDDRASVHPGASEGPPGDATCSDGIDNDCDGGKDQQDTGCKVCNVDNQCDDKNPCTADACVSGQCENTATSEGASCDDKNACTTGTVCTNGACAGGSAVSCQPSTNPCKQVSCNPASGCVTGNRADGTACNDGLYCTNPDACKAGVCTGPARDCSAGVLACHARTCNESTDQCVDSLAPDGTACDDKDACTQGESCKGGSCTPPPILNELVAAIGIGDRTDRTIVVDAAGDVHTVFHGGNSLRYATNKTGSWVNETVATVAAATSYPSLFLDAQGTLHVAFVDASGELRHAKRGSAGWTVATVVTPAKGPTSLVVTPTGTVHILFTRGNNQELHHATSGATWTLTQVDAVAATQYSLPTSMVLDAQGKLHVVAGLSEPFRLRYYTNASGSWVGSSPGAISGSHGLWPSLAIGPTGNLYISHQASDQTKAVVFLTTRTAAGWQTITAETVPTASGSSSGRFTSLVLDGQEKVHIVYRNAVQDLLRHITNRSGAWVGQDLDTAGGNTGRWPALARAPSGRIHITYERESANQVRHVTFSACP